MRSRALFPRLPVVPQQPSASATPLIERIEIANNQKETLLFCVASRPGGPFDGPGLREDSWPLRAAVPPAGPSFSGGGDGESQDDEPEQDDGDVEAPRLHHAPSPPEVEEVRERMRLTLAAAPPGRAARSAPPPLAGRPRPRA